MSTIASTCLRSSHSAIFHQHGSPETVLSIVDTPLDPPNADQLYVRILAAPINPSDIGHILGNYPVKSELPAVPGLEGLVEVMEVGSDVQDWNVGDWALGTWRSHAVVHPSWLYKIAKTIDVLQAATIAVNPCTAYRMLKDFVQLQPGDFVIQTGANSAVGLMVIQLAREWNLKTVNIIRNRPNVHETIAQLKLLGATHVVTDDFMASDERRKWFEENVPNIQLGLDCVSGSDGVNMARTLKTDGHYVNYGAMSREPLALPASLLIFKNISVHGFWVTRWKEVAAQTELGRLNMHQMIEELQKMMAQGKLHGSPHEIVPLSTCTTEKLQHVLAQAQQNYRGKKMIFINE